jgi:hypothetical protein
VTAVPFGLAIRDTLNEPTHLQVDEPESPEEYEQRMLEEGQHAEKVRMEAKLTEIDGVIGKAPASLGAGFAGIELGAPAPFVVYSNALAAYPHLAILMERGDDTVVRSVAVRPAGPDNQTGTDGACERMQQRLVAAWGPSSDGVWFDMARHRRASFGSDCELKFDSFLDPGAWVAHLPLDLVGTTTDEARAQLGEPVEVKDHSLSFMTPGLGLERTLVEVAIEGDKVTGLHVSVPPHNNVSAVVAALTAKLGKPMHDPAKDSEAWDWRKPPVHLIANGETIMLMIGKVEK